MKVPHQRVVLPELLDSLPPEHPDALRNRLDLRRINGLMGNFRWIAAQLRVHHRDQEPIIEPGAGQGDLGLCLARDGVADSRLPEYAGLDLWPRPEAWPAAWDWKQEDLLAFSAYDAYPVFVANLILHQFEDGALLVLGDKLRENTRVIVVTETLRAERCHLGMRLLSPFVNHVSRHDARVSIDSGFRDTELPTLLGLRPPNWRVQVQETLLGSYRMVAVRNETRKDRVNST